jgi:uncharacterized protein (DUF433 family)
VTETELPPVRKTPGVCGGRACVGMRRLPVWSLVTSSRLGVPDDELLTYFCTTPLSREELDAAWEYYRHNALEIERDMWWNDTAGNYGEGEAVPAEVIVQGKLLGLSDDEVRGSFDPPLSAAAVVSAWAEYRRQPTRFVAVTRQAG